MELGRKRGTVRARSRRMNWRFKILKNNHIVFLGLKRQTLPLLTHIASPGQALSVVAHQCHETGNKQVPLCVGTGATRGIVDVIPLHQNLRKIIQTDIYTVYDNSIYSSFTKPCICFIPKNRIDLLFIHYHKFLTARN